MNREAALSLYPGSFLYKFSRRSWSQPAQQKVCSATCLCCILISAVLCKATDGIIAGVKFNQQQDHLQSIVTWESGMQHQMQEARDSLIRVKQRLLGTGAISRSARDLEMMVCICPRKKRHCLGFSAPACCSNSNSAAFN